MLLMPIRLGKNILQERRSYLIYNRDLGYKEQDIMTPEMEEKN
jgi:hypothetical protein